MSTKREITYMPKSDVTTRDIIIAEDGSTRRARFWFVPASELTSPETGKRRKHVMEVNGQRCGLTDEDLRDLLELIKEVYES